MTQPMPEGWSRIRIEEIIEDLQAGFASGEKNAVGGVAQLRMNNIGVDGELVLDLVRSVPASLAKPRHQLRPGDVLVCSTNSGKLVGKSAHFNLRGHYVFSNHLTRLRPNPFLVDGRFLRWGIWLLWKSGVLTEQCKHWVNQSTLPKEALLKSEIPLPPFSEQQRIVAKLETLLSKVESCNRRLEKIPLLLKRFRQSVLAAACSGRLTADWREASGNLDSDKALSSQLSASEKYSCPEDCTTPELPESWSCVPIANVAEFQQGMQIAKKTRLKEKGPNRLPILRIGNYASGFTDGVDYVELDEDSLVAEPQDVILARTGETRGKVLTGYRGVFHNNTFRINYDEHFLTREYLIAWLNTDSVQSFIRQGSARSAQPDLTHKAFGLCPLSLPSLDEQREIVRRLGQLFDLADRLESRYTRAQNYINKLTPSLLNKAFSGELVRQNPTEESASALLARIRSRATSTQIHKRKIAKA